MIQTMLLDPNSASYTDNEIVTKINNASNQITRASCVSTAARPIGSGEISNTELASGVAKSNLDAMSDTARGYIQTSPTTGQFKVVSIQRSTDGKLNTKYDDTPF
jgi:hypothetical protein